MRYERKHENLDISRFITSSAEARRFRDYEKGHADFLNRMAMRINDAEREGQRTVFAPPGFTREQAIEARDIGDELRELRVSFGAS